MFYVVFLNVYEFYKLDIEAGPIRSSPSSTINVIAVMPVICFAYQCHEIVIPVYSCMEDRSIKAFSKVTALALGILFVLYCTAGTYGYLTFGSKVSPDIMQLYDAKDPFVIVGIVALVVKMITTYPPMIVCGRGALDGLYAEFRKLSAADFIEGEPMRRFVITSIWFATSLVIAIFTPNIGVVIELLGSLASANVFIFPSLCLIAIVNRPEQKITGPKKILFYAFSITLIVVGLTIFAIVMFQVVIDFQKSGENITHELLCK
jgi:sodium-coupled neutral amino acid transporter 7/8